MPVKLSKLILVSAAFILVNNNADAESISALQHAGIPSAPDGQWAEYVIDHLDVRTFPSSLGNRRHEGKITFADFGIAPISLTADKAILGNQVDWIYTITVLTHDARKITVCFADHVANGGTYNAQEPLVLTVAADHKHLVGAETSDQLANCPSLAR